jgi:hypothetical protein
MSGAPVDIISGRPIAPGFGRKTNMADEAGELMEKMQMVGLPASAAAQAVAAKIIAVLENRIAVVLTTDQQAVACLEILRSIQAPAITASAAARRYVKRFYPLTPALADETTPEKEGLYQ